MNVALSGASGLIGSALTRSLEAAGSRCHRLVRRTPSRADELEWRPEHGLADSEAASGLDVLVHLAGENVAGGRWTTERRSRIGASRGPATRRLVESLSRLEQAPRVFVCASAVGYYGDRGDELLDEDSTSGGGFLASVCREWESAALTAGAVCERVAILRFGVVLSARGGALARMLTPFRLGLGGRLGSGRQYFPWIHIDDAVAAILHVMKRDIRGPVNIVAPEQVTNADLTRAIAATLGRPALLPVPSSALRLAFGAMARETLLASARVVPTVLRNSNFRYRFSTLDAALDRELSPDA
ncbi:MAG: TIGR01777 family protein [Holophagales bacterium]|nr:TIGR01777 family protein [Holophagales bacterium]MYD21063.1 TIGR01777 family protein [Holophagales bacterium]MYI33177.1 TIGR01777 family protein [Holophagales bacterium]